MELFGALVIAYFIGLAIGIFVARLIYKSKNVGTFKINHSDPTTDFCTLALDKDIDVIEKHKYISLKVETQ